MKRNYETVWEETILSKRCLLHSELPSRALTLCTLRGTVRLKRDGTQWRTGGEVKRKLADVVGSQYSSHYLGTRCIQHYYRWCAHLGCQQSTGLMPPADLNGLVRFAERRNLFSAHVPSHFKRGLQQYRWSLELHLKLQQLSADSPLASGLLLSFALQLLAVLKIPKVALTSLVQASRSLW